MENYKEIEITKHAYLRMKQRNGWSKKTANRMVSRIYNSGKRPEEVKGYLRAWINTKVDENAAEKDFVLYGQQLYIFIDNAMITVLPTPSKEYVLENIFCEV